MTGIENIVQQILRDAERDAEAIRASARKQAAGLLEAAKEEAARDSEADERLAHVQAEEEKRRVVIVAELAVRRELLAKKQGLLNEAYNQALDKLMQLPDADWDALITKLVAENAETGSEVLQFSKDDTQRGHKLLPALNAALVAKGLPGELSIDNTPGDFSGGVVLVGLYTELNATFEALLRSIRDESETEAAALLF